MGNKRMLKLMKNSAVIMVVIFVIIVLSIPVAIVLNSKYKILKNNNSTNVTDDVF